MAVRIVEDDLTALLLDWEAGANLLTFIQTANILTDKVAECAIDKGTPLSAAVLKEIERYLAAHFYSVYDSRYLKKKTERASGEFALLPFLDQAKLLDTSGCLDSFTSNKTARMDWLGKPPSTQIDYVDRD